MGKSWIPLSGYKKTSEDGQKATLRHPHGHEITLAKSLLSDNMKSQLASLPLHGAPQKFAQGGRVKKMANGGGLEIEAVDPNADSSQANASQQNQTAPSESAPSGGQMTGPPSSGPMGGFGPNSPYNMSPGKLMDKAYDYQMRGVQGAADAQSAGAMHQAEAITQGQQQLKQDAGALQSMIGSRMKELTDFAIDYGKQKINPNEFWEDKSTAGKVATGIGVLLGGLGQGLMGTGQNPVMQFIQEQIRNNIKAQIVNMNKKETVFGMNMKLLGNQEDAMQMTMNQHLAALGMDIEKAGLQSKSAQAQSEAMQMKGQIWNEMSKNVMNWSLKSLMDAKGGYGNAPQQGGGQPQGGMPVGPGGQQGPWSPDTAAATPQQPRQPSGDPRLSQMAQYMTPEERQRVVDMPGGGALMSNIPDAAARGAKIMGTHAALDHAIGELERTRAVSQGLPGTSGYRDQSAAMGAVQTLIGQLKDEDEKDPGRLNDEAKKGLHELTNFSAHHSIVDIFNTDDKFKAAVQSLRTFNQNQLDAGFKGLLGNKFQDRQQPQNQQSWNQGG